MERRRVFEIVTIGLWLTIAVVLYLHYTRKADTSLPVPENLVLPDLSSSIEGKKYEISKIIVLRGDTFDITLKDNDKTRVLGVLSVPATDDSKEKVLDLLNNSVKPHVVLKKKQDDNRWLIELYFTNDDKVLNLSEWLVLNKLVYK